MDTVRLVVGDGDRMDGVVNESEAAPRGGTTRQTRQVDWNRPDRARVGGRQE